jgi:serine/threonine-protein kinase
MEHIGKYEILDRIGVGGFGVVYKGYDPFIKRFVAVKTCTSDDEEIRNRFHQEAEIAGNLQHRNVVTVYDFGVQDGVPYLVQEYLSGEDLDRKIKTRAPLSFPEKLLYLVQVARGLEYAHSKGVIHRDIKPANIRILEDGTAKIMDFGIAKLQQQQSGLTQTGMTLGTAAYLAPEQIRGEPVNQRTDIFSYGILAYELLTYERPYGGEVISTVLYQILHLTPRSIGALWPDCPPQLSSIVGRCLEKEPTRRYLSCSELLRDLDALLRKQRAQRALGDSSGQLGAAGSLTRSLPSPGATPAAPAAAPAAAPSALATVPVERLPAPAADAGVGDLDLSYQLDRHRRTPRSISTSAVYRHKEIPRGAWLAAFGALILLVAFAAWYWRAERVTAAASAGSPAAAAPAAAGPGGARPAPGPVSTPPAAAASPPPAASPAPPPPEPEPEPPPAPRPPERGTLVLAAAWNPEITVSVDGGPPRRLDRRESLEVAPGDHVLSFELLSPQYSAMDERRVRVRAGQRLAVENPILQPGRLTVLAAIGSVQAIVRVDDESLGTTPKINHYLRPGPHRVELVPLRAEAQGDPGMVIPLETKSLTDATLTFDLAKRTHQLNERPSAGGS